MERVLKILFLFIVSSGLTAWAQPDIDAISDGTVRVVSRSATKIGTGSGFVATRNGHVITNQHVIRGGSSFSIIKNGTKKEIPARIIGQSRALDLAILKVEADLAPPLTLSLSLPDAGQDVWALGFPGNADRLAEQVRPTITKGVLSNVFNGSWHNNNQLRIIQHSAGISPGSSGGPLFDNCGRVIGVNSKGSGSRVLHDASGNVVDVFAGTQIYFSSHVHETIEFLRDHGISASGEMEACRASLPEEPIQVADIDELRREIDAARSLAAQNGETNNVELQRLEEQLNAATTLNLQQSQDISLAMRASLIAAATGILMLILLMFRSPRAQVLRVAHSSSRPRTQPSAATLPRTRTQQRTEFVLTFSNGYIDGSEYVVLTDRVNSNFIIGQNEELSDLALDDPRLSPRHLRLSLSENGTIMLEDLNSNIGTMVERQTLKPFRPHALRIGSSFVCGNMHFRLRPKST